MRFAGFSAAVCLVASCGGHTTPEAKQQQPSAKPVQILQFYSNTPDVPKGSQVLICYGVENATSVRLEPPIEEIVPALVRCIPYYPAANAEIKLIATGAGGSETSKTIQIKVGPAAPSRKSNSIVSFASSATSVAPGQEVTFCYSTSGATAVKLEPSAANRTLPLKGCVTEHVSQKTTFTLVATGPQGKEDRESLVISVTR